MKMTFLETPFSSRRSKTVLQLKEGALPSFERELAYKGLNSTKNWPCTYNGVKKES